MEYAAKYETSLEGLVLISSVYTDYKPQNTFAFLKTGMDFTATAEPAKTHMKTAKKKNTWEDSRPNLWKRLNI